MADRKNTIKGLTVEIGGDTTKLGKALEDVNKKSQSLSSELGDINRLLKMDPGNTELIAQKQKVLAEAIANSADKLKTLKEAEKQVQEQFERGEISEEQLRALQREIVATESKMQSYEKAAEETAGGVEQLDEAEEKAEKTSGKLGETLASVAKVGFAAVATAAAAAAAAATAAAAALIDMAVEGGQYADTVLTEATVTGIATDKLQEYMYAAELVDVSTETLTKSMAKNIKSMKSAADGSQTVAEAYDALGVRITDANGGLRDGETVYWELIDALGAVENETERDALAMTLLGKSAQELNPLIEAGADRMTELGKEARAAGYVLSDDTLNAYGALDDAMQRLDVGATAAKNALGTVLLPTLTDLAGAGVEMLNKFTAGIAGANGNIDEMADVVADVLPQAIDKIADYVPAIVSVAGSVIGAFAGALTDPDTLNAVLTAAGSIVSTLASGVITNLPTIVSSALGMILTLCEGLLSPENIDNLIEAGVGIIVTLATGLADALPRLIPSVVRAVVTIVQTLTRPETLSQLLTAVFALAEGAADGILQAIPVLIDALPAVISGIIKFFTAPENTKKMIRLYLELFGAIVKAIPEILKSILLAVRDIMDAIVTGLKDGTKPIRDVGKNLVKGLWEGISDMVGWVKDKIKGFSSSILDGIKSFFGVHSPSKEMAWIGEMLDKGLAEGIEDAAGDPIKAMDRVSSDVLGATGELDGLNLTRTLQVQNEAAEAEKMADTGLLSRLDKILRAIEDGQTITIDGKELVGATCDRLDAALGQRRLLAARGALA